MSKIVEWKVALKLSIKLSMSFSRRQKILKCLWSKHFELQKCGHTDKSNDGLNLSIILMFLTVYGVRKFSDFSWDTCAEEFTLSTLSRHLSTPGVGQVMQAWLNYPCTKFSPMKSQDGYGITIWTEPMFYML